MQESRQGDQANDRRAEAAAVNAIASGSQHNTIKAISHRIAFSLSVAAPMSSATYRIGAAAVCFSRMNCANAGMKTLSASHDSRRGPSLRRCRLWSL
jgi:hypothetical protein